MITRGKILTTLAACGILFLSAAGIFYEWGWVDKNGYFRFYAFGLLFWAIRMKMQKVSLVDALVLNVVLWLCIFNVMDELISKTPATPYKPWIASSTTILTTIYIYYSQCRRNRKE